MRLRSALALALAIGATLPLAAPAGGQDPLGGKDPKSLVAVVASPVEAKAGGRATARIALTVATGWHVNANPPALDYMIPTELSLASVPGVQAGPAVYPPPHKTKLSFENTELLVYDGAAAVEIPIEVEAGTPPGARTLKGKVRFQACNDQVCLAPVDVPFDLTVSVAAAAAAPESTGAQAPAAAIGTGFTTAPPPGRPAAAGGDGLDEAMRKGGAMWLIALFVGGLLLNLTPCVFPMLGVTVSIFGARRQEPLPRVMGAAALYVLGICVMYSSLGVLAALTGGLFGSALQSPWVGVGLGALMALLSLSMFGLYEMQPPAWLLQRLGGAGTSSAIGLFLSGLAVGVIAAPCVGPFVVAVLALIARRGQAVFGFRTMFALSLGLGFPYLLLATFSNLLQRLPRSGDWMVWVKKVFGVILLSVGVFYVLIGLAPAYSVWVMPVALVLGGAYLGFLEKSAPDRRGFRTLKLALGSLALVAGVWLIATAPRTGLAFRPYDAAGLDASLGRGEVAMLDFSADWCVPCRELEQATFTDARVKSMAQRFVTYRVDLTRYDSPESEALRRKYAIPGVPAVVFIGPDGREIERTRVQGFVPPEPMLERMRIAAEARGK